MTTLSRRATRTDETVAERVKRALDLVGASVLLVVLSPLFALVAVVVAATSRGPVIFRQTRLGRYGEPFTVYKFRSMASDADPEVHRRFLRSQLDPSLDIDHFKVIDDCRVTGVGRFLRRTSIDELPQLVNVVKGEMSLVGPRPDLPYSVENYEPHHFRRFDVAQGLTGLWQVSGRSNLSYVDMLELDVAYADSWTLAGDLRILIRTAGVLARPDKAG